MRTKLALLAITGFAALASGPAMADYYDLFLDGYYSDPNFWNNPNDPNCGYYDVQHNILRLDPNLYDPNVVPWDCDNPMWQIWCVDGDRWQAWVNAEGLNLWSSALPTWPFHFIGATVNMPPYTYKLYPNMNQDPNFSETFFNKDKSHYMICYMKWPDPNRGEGYIGHHASPSGWTGMFLGVQLHPGQQPYVYMHCAPDGGLFWYGPGGTYNLDLGQGVWMLFGYDADGDTTVPNAPAGVPLWKSAMWNGDKYANAPTGWTDKNYVMVSRADTGQPLVYKNFGSWLPDETRYVFHDKGLSLFGVYGIQREGQPMEDFPGWVVVNHVECRNGAEWSHVPHRLTLTVYHDNWGSVEVDPALPDPNDPNTRTDRVFRYTEGTEVVLTAMPVGGKGFKAWTIYDPNFPGDVGHATMDSNSVLYLTMDADWQIEVDFKCGSGLPPFIAAAVLALGVAVAVRRFT
jgi:hypothetical protein